MSLLALLIFSAFLVAVVAVRQRMGMPSNVALLPHQKGILYRRGVPIRSLGPGKHRVMVGVEKIIFLDARQIQVGFENQAVALSDGAVAVYGFSGTAEVIDVRKVMYSAANFSQVPAFVLLCCVRGALNRKSISEFRANKDAVASEIVSEASSRLQQDGFELSAFRFTHLSIAGLAHEQSTI